MPVAKNTPAADTRSARREAVESVPLDTINPSDVVHRFRRRKGFDREEAARVGCLELLEAVAAEVEHEDAAADPGRFGEVRVELMLELLFLGASSPLARQMGLTDVETRHQLEAARSTVAELLRELPSARASLAAALQSCFIALAVKRNGAAAQTPRLATAPFRAKLRRGAAVHRGPSSKL